MTPTVSSIAPRSMRELLAATARRVDGAIDRADLPAGQGELLKRAVNSLRASQQHSPLANPVILFWLVVRAWRRPVNDAALAVAAFCEFYVLSLSLFDDIQDEELAGTAFAATGPAIAINSALLFLCIGLGELRVAMELEPDPRRKLEYLRVFNETSLRAGSGQYLDLLGGEASRAATDVMSMELTKTSSTRLLCELAALFAGCDPETVERYRHVGEQIALLAQIVGDVSDLFSGQVSRDLSMRKVTYPIACFLELAGAPGESEIAALRDAMPSSLPALRARLYESGTIKKVAGALETVRAALHAEVAATRNYSAAHRTLLFGLDALCRKIYRTPDLPCSEALFRPEGAWHIRVRALSRQFAERMSGFAALELPRLEPWHLPQWMYDPEQRLIYYPDVEGQPEETVTFQAALLATDDLGEAMDVVETVAPAVMAHEMFHYWRDFTGRLSRDLWLEERIANSLALAYCQAFEPEVFRHVVGIAQSIEARWEGEITAPGRQILTGLLGEGPRSAVTGYGVGARELAVIHLALIARLAERLQPLEVLVAEHLARGQEGLSP
jgi:geranylgeranyl pyrophosphate synthase